jgi:hypothetical protein
MSAIRAVRRLIILGLAVGFVVAMIGSAEAQIFRRPKGAVPADPNSPPPRGLFPGRQSRQNPEGQNPGEQFSNGQFPGGTIPRTASPNTVLRPNTAIPGAAAAAPQEEIFIVVPLDEKPFQIEPTDYVRLTAGGAPGSEFSTKITGPARVHRQVFVAGAAEGKYTVGTDETEYEFAMTGLGKVKIDLIVTIPNGAAPTVMTYQFEVVAPKN